MRLLNTETLVFEQFFDTPPRYAILSHRWGEEEVTHKDIELGRHKLLRGWSKIKACCRLARSRRYRYAWIDTCCIDKNSSAELTEAINSMYRWYENAGECYVYLSDVYASDQTSSEIRRQFASSKWFTRGWTLQELIAPETVLFWDRKWQYLGNKQVLYSFLEQVSGIDADVLLGDQKPSGCSISKRMSWAADRVTTRVEDRAYSLLGLFHVNMPMLYGEGERAFKRLQQEIINQSDDHTIFAWQSDRFAKAVLASSPLYFKSVKQLIQLFPANDTTQGFTLVNTGLSIQLSLIPWTMNTYLAPLRCGFRGPTSADMPSSSACTRVCLFVQQTRHDSQYVRVAVEEEDLKVMDGNHIARIRREHNILKTRILLCQPFDTSNIRAVNPAFYGFQFEFRHNGLFSTGHVPSAADALCYHEWKHEEPVFEVETGGLHAAGLFRLSGVFTDLYMYLGFDLDFAPLCLITRKTPRSGNSRRLNTLPSDFSRVSKTEAIELLDLNWLRSQVTESRLNSDTILALKGKRQELIEVEVQSLALLLTFHRKWSNVLSLDAWHLTMTRSSREAYLSTPVNGVKVNSPNPLANRYEYDRFP